MFSNEFITKFDSVTYFSSSFRYDFNHGSDKASDMLIRFRGSLSSSLRIKAFAASVIPRHMGLLNSSLPYRTFFKISISYFPPNGGSPDNRTYMITPKDQESHF